MMNSDPKKSEEQHLSPSPPRPGRARIVHRHLLAVCARCAESWRSLSRILRAAYRQVLAETALPASPPSVLPEDLAADPSDVEALEARLADLSRLRRHARQQMSELRNTPRHRRVGMVKGASRRFRSGLLAELLIDEAREWVRLQPAEAESFAGLVVHVLVWDPGVTEPPWATLLLARGAAHRANALRVAGDLRAADAAFRELHRNLARRPVAEPGALGEIASLEASLRIDQRRLDEAEELLRLADLSFRLAGDADGRARALIQQINLADIQSRPKEVLRLLATFDGLEAETTAPYRSATAVTRVGALCDLGRPAEANEVLQATYATLEGNDPRTDASLRTLEGRILLLSGQPAAAEERFKAAALLLWELGRAYDAALASLDLARALLAQGRHRELRHLAARLVQGFQRFDVAPEAAEAGRLLQRAAESDVVTTALLAEVQRRLLQLPATA